MEDGEKHCSSSSYSSSSSCSRSCCGMPHEAAAASRTPHAAAAVSAARPDPPLPQLFPPGCFAVRWGPESDDEDERDYELPPLPPPLSFLTHRHTTRIEKKGKEGGREAEFASGGHSHTFGGGWTMEQGSRNEKRGKMLFLSILILAQRTWEKHISPLLP